MSEEIKGEVVTFRLTKEQYRAVGECALRAGCSPNEWCRKLTLSEAARDCGMTMNERILLEEIGVIRHLFGRYLKRELPAEEYEKLRLEVEQHYTAIGETLLEKRAAAKAF